MEINARGSEKSLSFCCLKIDNVFCVSCLTREGSGQLLSVYDASVPKYGQEINDHQLAEAQRRLENFKGYCGDTLKDPAFADMRFDCIVGNYPFSIKWEPVVDWRFKDAPTIPTKGRADYAFILHILAYLADDGVASVLCFPGILYRGNREGTLRQWLVEQNYLDTVVYIEGDTFVDTKIATVLMVFRKDRTSTDVRFIKDDTGEEIIVPQSQIREANFNLSPNEYFVPPAPEKEEIDPAQLELDVQRAMLRNFENVLQMHLMTCTLSGVNYRCFLRRLERAIHKAKDMVFDF